MSDFTRRAFFDDPKLVGARWWQEQLAGVLGRRDSLRTLGMLAVGLLGVGAAARLVAACAKSPATSGLTDDDLHVTKDALELQRADGWDVGKPGQGLVWPQTSSVLDIDGKPLRPESVATLAADLSPTDPRYSAYFVPTLLQWPASLSETDRATIVPMHTAEMDRAFAQGHAFASLFKEVPKETAVIVDMPGPLAVAFAAGMAETFEPVFGFDNWPHPVGVVASHQTLAACVYYAPLLKRLAKERPVGAPMALVLDSNRLAPYTDSASQFDNRYLGKVPTPDKLKLFGIRHVMYATDGATKELDDLNDDFVALKAADLAPKLVDRNDFVLATGADAKTLTIGNPDAGAAPPNAGYTYAPAPVTYVPSYYYGGYPTTHYWFWHSYGWYTPPSYRYARAPSFVSSAPSYAPSPRPTMFTGSGDGVRTRPAGFGRVSVTTSRSSGQTTSTSYGGRTGSFGRSSSGGGGGYGGGYSG